MESVALKRSVLKAAMSHLEATVKDLQERITDLKSITLGDDNAESASQTESMRGSDVELMNSLGEQLDHVQQDMERLNVIDPAIGLEVVQYGAVVHTDQRNFLIGASLEEFDAGGKRYLGVTSKAPVIQAIYGMRKGENATVNGTTYTITEIY